MKDPTRQGGRILLVANRLPVNIQRGATGLEFHPSPGGLATGLSSLQGEFETVWIGWPGIVGDEDRASAEQRLREEFHCRPVFLSEHLVEKYYEGFSNSTIWPIFHSFPAYASFSSEEWDAYCQANASFADIILQEYRPRDILWIHDYHLMLLPQYLRRRLPDATMGFFLHIPFPHHDIFRLVPQHREILSGMLSLDLIGFHTHDYVEAFLSTVRKVTGHNHVAGQLQVGDHIVQVDAFPMGIDFAKYSDAPDDPALRTEVTDILNHMRTRKRVFSVSRLDYTKGVPESITAYQTFLSQHPEWHKKVGFILVVVPSREGVEQYASLKKEIDELVGRINSEFGTLDWTPIRYIYRSLTWGELIGLYAAADVALITPLRDGMNLIAKEYLAVKNDSTGVLILSELAGAAKETPEALLVNPNSRELMAEAIHNALLMPKEEQEQRNTLMRQRLATHDIRHWVRSFFTRLREVQQRSRQLAVETLGEVTRQRIVKEYSKSARRLLVLDYDGTLTPFADTPRGAHPDKGLINLLQRISLPQQNHVVILSGRNRESLQEWLGNLRLTLVAEHGGWMRLIDQREWTPTMPLHDIAWKDDVRPSLQLFASRVEQSFVEEKDFSLVWHYRQAEAETAEKAARELLDHLATFTLNLNVQVLRGNKTVEVRTSGIGKGLFFLRFLMSLNPDFILAFGDDWTDEELFVAMPPEAYTIKVGPHLSRARFNVPSIEDVRSLLDDLSD